MTLTQAEVARFTGDGGWCPGAGPVRVLSREEIDAVRAEITPVEQIPLFRSSRTLFPLVDRRACGRRYAVSLKDGR